MLTSMTGFAAAKLDASWGTLQIDLRSVNHRYLELHFRLTDDLRQLEGGFREALNRRLGRGKVECRASLTPAQAPQLALNRELVEELARLGHEVAEITGRATHPTVADWLRWPGVLIGEHVPEADLQRQALLLLGQAIDELQATRTREGQHLANNILARVTEARQHVATVRPLVPELVAQHKERLRKALEEAGLTPDHERLHHEVVSYAQRIDVDEELTRLCTHLDEVERVVKKGGIAGKRLDFLLQELNREANTLGSKSVSTTVTHAAVELKIIIEQIREQVQNIE